MAPADWERKILRTACTRARVDPAADDWRQRHGNSFRVWISESRGLVVRMRRGRSLDRLLVEQHALVRASSRVGWECLPQVVDVFECSGVGVMTQRLSDGVTLEEVMRVNPDRGSLALVEVSRILNTLAEDELDGYGPLQRDLRGESHSLKSWLLSPTAPLSAVSGRLGERLRSRAKDLLETLSDARGVSSHGDISPRNVLVHDRGVTLLDWETVKAAPWGLDAGWWECMWGPAYPGPTATFLHSLESLTPPAFRKPFNAMRQLTQLSVLSGHNSWLQATGRQDPDRDVTGMIETLLQERV